MRIFAKDASTSDNKKASMPSTLYYKKYVRPCINIALKVFAFMAHVAALGVIVGAVLEFGFALSDRLKSEFGLVYFWAWNMFLIERIGRLLLTKRGKRKSAYSFLGWTINGLLTLTLIPILVNFLGIDDSMGVMKILDNRVLHLLILFLISFIELSDAVITSLGRKSNPALMMAVSFMFIIMVGSGMLLMPRCIQQGVHLSWIDSLFTATSAVCVTGLTTIDVHVYQFRTTGDHDADSGGRTGCDDHHQFFRPLLHGEHEHLQPDAGAGHGELEIASLAMVHVA